MYRALLLLCLLCLSQLLAAQTATQICSDGRVLPLTPFNRNPCGSTPETPSPEPAGESSEPAGETTPAPSSDSTITCEDGRVVQRTPFNPSPCRVSAPAAAADVPDEFLALFGETPAPRGLALEDRLVEQAYKARFDGFVAEIPAPEGFTAVAERYAQAGLGEAGFYQDRSGARVRWSEAPFYPAEASAAVAVAKPDAVIAAWQAQAILRGGVVESPLASVPATVRSLNEDRLRGVNGTSATTPAVLAWSSSSRRALAVVETGPELVGPLSNSSPLTAPAAAGGFVSIFAVGLGSAQGLEVSLNGSPLPKSDFAAARIADNRGGLWRIAFRIPADAPAGDASVTVTVAGVSSHAGPQLTISR